MNRFSSPFVNLRNLLLAALTAWAVVNFYETVRYIVNDYSPTPLFDYWREVQLWPFFKASHWTALWAQHNEHRIIFPELIYVADMFLLRGRMYLPVVLSGCFYVGVWAILAVATYTSRAIEFPARELGLLLAAVMLSWKSCSTLIATPFQLQFTLLQFVSALALLALALFSDRRKAVYLAVAVVAAVVGTYSSGNGMLLWVVLLAAGGYLRLSLRAMAVLFISGALSIGLYFFDYHFMRSSIGINLRHPILACEFVCAFFSMPFGTSGIPWHGIAYGGVNIALMMVALIVAWKCEFLQSRLGVVIFGLYLFTLLSAMLTAGSRMDINDRTFAAAKTWRYVSMPMVAWALLAIAFIWLAGRLISVRAAWVGSVVFALFFASGFRGASASLEASRQDFANAQIATTMFVNQVFDPPSVLTIFPSTEFVKSYLPMLQSERKMFYARGADKWIGQSVDHLKPLTDPVPGAITGILPFEGGIEIIGWVDGNAPATGDHAVLFVDSARRIVGFGNRPKAGFPPSRGSFNTPDQFAFLGFIANKGLVGPLSVYVRTGHGRRLQPLEGTIAVPNFARIDPASKIAPLLPNVAWQANPDWTLRGYTVTPTNKPAPPGNIYASYSGSDAKTGIYRTEPFASPANHCLVVPTLTGGSAYGQSVQIIDADTNQPIASFPLSNSAAWERWKVNVPANITRLQIVAADRGISLFQWVAVAAPEQCQ